MLTQDGFILSGLRYWPSDQQAEIRYGNGVRTAYTYDSRLRLKTLNTAPQAAPASPLIAFAYEFDGVSNIRRIDDQRPGSVVPAGDPRRNSQFFQYDDLYRLTRVQYSFALPGQGDRNDGQIAYRYDRIGNMLAQLSTIDHVEKGLPVANLGAMDSGGIAGRWNRTGRSTGDEPGPHALTAITAPSTINQQPSTRYYPYDPNGNMTNLDGMVAMWDFKDRLVRLEDTNMVANYTYDFTDRRITKKVFWIHGEPSATTNPPSTIHHQPSTTAVTYVGKHFEVREHEAPTKYVWNGNTRVARVTGTLMPANLRVQRLRVAAGWNLVSLALTVTNAAHQLSSLSASGAEGQGEVVQSVFKWRADTRAFAAVSPSETLPAGTVLWIKAAANATLRVLGRYDGPPPSIRAPPEGDFLPGSGLEVWNVKSSISNAPLATLWTFAPDRQNWQTQFAPPLTPFSDFPPVLAVGQAFYGSAPAPVELEQPPGALSLRYYHQDHLGSSSAMSDTAGQFVEESAIYPFGATRNQDRPRKIQEAYQFTQKERDTESGLHYFETRYLGDRAGRFIRTDPLAMEVPSSWKAVPQKLHPYTYCGNNPIVRRDPSGTDDVPAGQGDGLETALEATSTTSDLAKDFFKTVAEANTESMKEWAEAGKKGGEASTGAAAQKFSKFSKVAGAVGWAAEIGDIASAEDKHRAVLGLAVEKGTEKAVDAALLALCPETGGTLCVAAKIGMPTLAGKATKFLAQSQYDANKFFKSPQAKAIEKSDQEMARAYGGAQQAYAGLRESSASGFLLPMGQYQPPPDVQDYYQGKAIIETINTLLGPFAPLFGK